MVASDGDSIPALGRALCLCGNTIPVGRDRRNVGERGATGGGFAALRAVGHRRRWMLAAKTSRQ